ncbi:MAG: amino acid adenylation domain-containing protein [Rickettsiales bacterium]|nr:amino acid adenylation domain-containing protein [Rickettsiales bacterium]
MGLRFKDIAQQHAMRNALSFPNGPTLTYSELDAASDKAAAHLLAQGGNASQVLAIHAEKSALTYIAMIAALKIGMPYVVLDTASPMERLDKILQRCNPAIIVADRPFAWAGKQAMPLESLRQKIAPIDVATIANISGSTPAYIMFTSGSTGFPKGVTISHASMVNFCEWARTTFSITPDDVLSGANALYFDNSVFDFSASLFNGACLVPIDRDTVTQPKALVEAAKNCSLWFSVPSLLIYVHTLRALTAASWPSMRAIIFGGEGFPKSELKKLYGLYGKQATLWNVYGPTECTCICSAYGISERDFDDMDKLAPLGHMAPNFTSAVLDESGKRIVAPGETGELLLMGPQVALGYYNDPERNQLAFAPSPLSAMVPQPCYRTGDLVWQDGQTGYYHFAGRKDNQIKHMGYRIELEEIEAALASFDAIAQSAVIYHKKTPHGGSIIAFVSATSANLDAIKQQLRDRLPSYMIPDDIIIRDQLPKNANGKVDRKALAATYGAEHG